MRFLLVQRLLKRHSSETQCGVDRVVNYDYMGSSEYEYGTLGANLKKMRAEKDITSEPYKLKVGAHTCWLIGSIQVVSFAMTFFEQELKGYRSDFQVKDGSMISDAYETQESLPLSSAKDLIGWWVYSLLP